jgi:hypothetical protein
MFSLFMHPKLMPRRNLQELLSHPFLRPTAAAAQDSLVGVSKDQLKKLLVQVRVPFLTSSLLVTRPLLID